MKIRTYSRNSLHWRLASVYGPLGKFQEETDICEYLMAVLSGCVVALFLTICACVLSTPFADLIAWIFAIISAGKYVEIGIGAIFALAIITAFAFSQVFTMLIIWHENRLPSGNHPSQFCANAIYSWKKKVCFKIKFE